MSAASQSEPLFAPLLHSERLTYTLLDLDNTDDEKFLLDVFNALIPGGGPSDGNWESRDFRTLARQTSFNESDRKGRPPGGAAVYIVHLGGEPGNRIGFFNLCRRSPEIPIDLGYGLFAEHQRKGYGTEGSKRILDYFFSEYGLKEICIVTDEGNVPACKIAEHNGFVDGGYVRVPGGTQKVFVAPGMQKLDGQDFPFWGQPE